MTCMQAAPFLLPLMFQLAFGLGAVQAGLLTLAYFMGNLLMKSITTPVLRRWGFRRVMTVGGTLAAATLFACATLQGDTALTHRRLAGGRRRDALDADDLAEHLAFADIEPAQRGAASTLSTMFAQLAAAMGAAMAPWCWRCHRWHMGATRWRRPISGWLSWSWPLLALLAVASFRRLKPDDGAEVSGHLASGDLRDDRRRSIRSAPWLTARFRMLALTACACTRWPGKDGSARAGTTRCVNAAEPWPVAWPRAAGRRSAVTRWRVATDAAACRDASVGHRFVIRAQSPCASASDGRPARSRRHTPRWPAPAIPRRWPRHAAGRAEHGHHQTAQPRP
jgi:hypothetical protein